MFNLRPMPALTKDVQLRTGDQLVQPQRHVQRHDTVIAAMDDQHLVPNAGNVIGFTAQRVQPSLVRTGEQGCETFLEPWPDAGLKPLAPRPRVCVTIC